MPHGREFPHFSPPLFFSAWEEVCHSSCKHVWVAQRGHFHKGQITRAEHLRMPAAALSNRFQLESLAATGSKLLTTVLGPAV